VLHLLWGRTIGETGGEAPLIGRTIGETGGEAVAVVAIKATVTRRGRATGKWGGGGVVRKAGGGMYKRR
jgi:hypothetical protein